MMVDKSTENRLEKPYLVFPLFASQNGQWCRKIRSKLTLRCEKISTSAGTLSFTMPAFAKKVPWKEPPVILIELPVSAVKPSPIIPPRMFNSPPDNTSIRH